ncbi:GH25 family lysozyme [Clostridium sp. DSM 8431]|uniref:GH25 family lysozyme n=1 Tax=Clostridium sp. DSM 8431 TaxID=1761781 RepID=UPI000B7F10A9|nr:GH25 family lysozyme [Clostridium sp. DSM 8431]
MDVSNHNGDINWSLVKKSGIECVYIKASERTTFIDDYMLRHSYGTKSVMLRTGYYHFLVGSSLPETQAENFYNCIKDKENDLLPCLDLEHSKNEPNNFMDYALRFIEKFKALSGMDICIYACPSFIEENLDKRLNKYPLWCAHYGADKPGFNKIWGSSYAGHQYTEEGRVPGIVGNVDMNNFNEEIFNNGSKIIEAAAAHENIYIPLQEELNRQDFRDKNGNTLVVDGTPGELTLSACPVVKKGARGNITKWIQEQLGIVSDGIFGDNTEEVVKKTKELEDF